MKRFILLFALCLIGSIGFAQKKNVMRANSELKQESPNYENARQWVKDAREAPETQNDAKTWWISAEVEDAVYSLNDNKRTTNQKYDESAMYKALEDEYTYLQQALYLDSLPNEKGKISPKYTKKIIERIRNRQMGFWDAAVIYYKGKEYKKAYEMWETYLSIPDKYGISEEKQKQLDEQGIVDSTYIFGRYYAALAAYISKDYELALPALNRAKDNDYDILTIYQCLNELYTNQKDSASLLTLSQEVIDKLGITKDTENFLLQMINIYITNDKINEAITYLDKAIEASPKAEYYKVKGRLFEEIGDESNAMICFNKALEMNPNLSDVWSEMGRIYYN
ncbi:MAG: hypothetical protein LUC18_00590, partial [Porphyromonadaceae bacterium]|nr:hypothetical protein [Porphyromonadaceae bacterium]